MREGWRAGRRTADGLLGKLPFEAVPPFGQPIKPGHTTTPPLLPDAGPMVLRLPRER